MEVKRLFDILDRYHQQYSSKSDALAAKENGKWITHSISDFVEISDNVAYGLLAMGLQREDKIALISNNRPEWNFMDMGILKAGGVDVPIYPTISEDAYRFILNDAEVKYVIVSDEELFNKIQNIRSQVPTLKEVYTFDKVNGAKHWTEIVETGKQNQVPDKVREIKATVKPEDLATLIYTSGTTGNPKGVMLSHKNLISNIMASYDLAPVDHTCKALSFLPLCHVYERMLTYYYMYLGVSIYYAESMETIGDNLKEVKPHIFTTVPRLLEKVYDKIVAKGNEQTGIKKSLFFWALKLGHQYKESGNGGWFSMQLNLANKIIFSKWREALGGNVRTIVSGGAALQPRLARVFWAAQIPVLEGYGLTETSPVIAVNNLKPGGLKFGTVGEVMNNLDVKIAEDGEIIVKGPSVMMGYYKRPDLTKEVIDEHGYFHTGDIGVFEDGKYLKITDRKKEMFKTSGGKYIAPQPLENKYKESVFIEQVMVVGESQKFAAALVVPAFAYLKEWCEKNGIPYSSNEEIIKNEKVKDQIWSEIDKYNQNFGKTEQVKKIKLLPTEWTVESGEMTPTLKLKRKIISENNKGLIEEIYN